MVAKIVAVSRCSASDGSRWNAVMHECIRLDYCILKLMITNGIIVICPAENIRVPKGRALSVRTDEPDEHAFPEYNVMNAL